MILKTIVNNETKKIEYPASSVEGINLLAQVPKDIFQQESVSMVGSYSDLNYIAIYFSPNSKVIGCPETNEMFSMKYNTNDGTYYFKTYESGNTTSNKVAGVCYTGKYSHNSNYTLYIHSEILPLIELLALKDGFIAKTYDADHNELYESLYITDVPS